MAITIGVFIRSGSERCPTEASRLKPVSGESDLGGGTALMRRGQRSGTLEASAKGGLDPPFTCYGCIVHDQRPHVQLPNVGHEATEEF